MFDTQRNVFPDSRESWHPSASHLPKVIEGLDVLDTVSPISKETGQRENALSLLTKVLDPKYHSLMDSIMQNIPAVNERPDIDDESALDMLVDFNRFGTPYERDLVHDRLISTLDVLLPKREQQKAAIQFSPEDAPHEKGDQI